MKKLTVQYLLKMTPELMRLIDTAFSEFLKKTGEYITKAEYVRRVLEFQCKSYEDTLADMINQAKLYLVLNRSYLHEVSRRLSKTELSQIKQNFPEPNYSVMQIPAPITDGNLLFLVINKIK
jgi:hypothetical protein